MGKKVTLENTSDSAICLPLSQTEMETLIIPRASKTKVEDKGGGEGRVVSTPGRAEIDSEVLERLQKNKVVATYFSTGRLRVVGSGPPPAPGADGGKGGK